MAIVQITTCDECQQGGTANLEDEVETYTVAVGLRQAMIDLCDKHSKPLRHLLAAYGGDAASPASGVSDSVFQAHVVDSFDEIEKAKQAYAKKGK